jgi:hypothetical protein
MTKTKTENDELVFKITTRVKATDKTPEMIYLSATNNLVRWGTFKKELTAFACDANMMDKLIFAEHGFWTSNDQIDKLIKMGKIKVEMK